MNPTQTLQFGNMSATYRILCVLALATLISSCDGEVQKIDSPYALYYRASTNEERLRFDPAGTLYFEASTRTTESFPLEDQTRKGFRFDQHGAWLNGEFSVSGIKQGSTDQFMGPHGCPEYTLYNLTLTYALGGTSTTWIGNALGCE